MTSPDVIEWRHDVTWRYRVMGWGIWDQRCPVGLSEWHGLWCDEMWLHSMTFWCHMTSHYDVTWHHTTNYGTKGLENIQGWRCVNAQVFLFVKNNRFLMTNCLLLISGVVFLNMNEKRMRRQSRPSDINLPPHIQYKIRVDVDYTPPTEHYKDLWVFEMKTYIW